jgi:hypothetical protein
MPLRVLYNQSDRVVVARVGDSRVVETGDNYLRLRTTLHVSSTVKGSDGERTVFFEGWATRESLDSGAYSKGDEVLVFLTRRHNGSDAILDERYGSDAILDERYGLKKLSGSDLKIYLQRISELATIMESGKPDPADLVEWLVRCTEEPATRWEGAYELNLSASMVSDVFADPEVDSDSLEGEEEGEGEEEYSEEEDEAVSAVEGEEVDVDEETPLISTFAMLLTESQKSRLVDALITSDEVGEGELLLIELSSSWNDPRLVPFLVSRLPAAGSAPYLAEQIMDVVSRLLGDKMLIRLSEQYGEAGADTSLKDDEQTTQSDNAGASDTTVNDRRNTIMEQFLARAEKRLKR